MGKILLVTIQDNHNFGNRLQNYALQEILLSLGHDVDNLDVMIDEHVRVSTKIKRIIKRCLSSMGSKRYNEEIKRALRIEGGKDFTKKYIENVIKKNRNELEDMPWEEYDHVVVGSDQVWHNWKRIPDELGYFYLSFVPSCKRIAYAASFGFTCFPKDDIDKHITGIKGMQAISCREKEGCTLINELTGRMTEKPFFKPARENANAIDDAMAQAINNALKKLRT